MQAHQALFYRDSDEYLDGIRRVHRARARARRAGGDRRPRAEAVALPAELGRRASRIELLDMAELGRNPGRIIPAVLAMIERHRDRPLRLVSEPIWAGRTPEEAREATRHEALINLAWPDADIRVLCPYDVASLDDQVLRDAEHTHPGVVRDGRLEASPAYGGGAVPSACEQPLVRSPAGGAERVPSRPRPRTAARPGSRSGPPRRGWTSDRAEELVTAINELTTNSVRHAGTHGLLRFWTTPGEVIFQVEDSGHIADPLAGRRRQAPAGAASACGWSTSCAISSRSARAPPGPPSASVRAARDAAPAATCRHRHPGRIARDARRRERDRPGRADGPVFGAQVVGKPRVKGEGNVTHSASQ